MNLGVRQIPKHELVATRLRENLRDGRWQGNLPGVVRLAAELDVSPHTIRRALRQLEADGELGGRGKGRSRGIITGESGRLRQPLRVAILRHDVRLTDSPQTSLILTEIMHSLEAAGYEVFLFKKSLLELKHDVPRITRQLATIPADAWVIEGGSFPLMEWCASQPTPSFALYGRTGTLPLARTGPDVVSACREATRQLIALGHRRIVLIGRETFRRPTLGRGELAFLEELGAHGIPTSSYNLPDWEETPTGFSRLLENLFKTTPPTALIVDETPRFFATVGFCAMHGIRVPEQVSLVSTDCDALMDWCHPSFAHIRWDSSRMVRRVVQWMNSVRKGKPDQKSIRFPAEFVPGGSIGPAMNR